jgi:hypothetical protein
MKLKLANFMIFVGLKIVNRGLSIINKKLQKQLPNKNETSSKKDPLKLV